MRVTEKMEGEMAWSKMGWVLMEPEMTEMG
jgi:hypothetical protein